MPPACLGNHDEVTHELSVFTAGGELDAVITKGELSRRKIVVIPDLHEAFTDLRWHAFRMGRARRLT
jgi:hypothetical protein